LSFTVSEILSVISQKLKSLRGHVTVTTPLVEVVCYPWCLTYLPNLKSFSGHEERRSKMQKWGGLG